MSFIYLANPYIHPSMTVMEDRFHKTEKVLADLLRAGITVFSPIVHCHKLAYRHDLPKDFAFWEKHDFVMLSVATSLYVLTIDGYEISRGVNAEIDYAIAHQIPIKYITLEGEITDEP